MTCWTKKKKSLASYHQSAECVWTFLVACRGRVSFVMAYRKRLNHLRPVAVGLQPLDGRATASACHYCGAVPVRPCARQSPMKRHVTDSPSPLIFLCKCWPDAFWPAITFLPSNVIKNHFCWNTFFLATKCMDDGWLDASLYLWPLVFVREVFC
jgi:hypothetical protein